MAPQAFKKISESITFAPHIDVDFSRGLSQDDVEQRKKLKLTNKTKKHVSRSYSRIIFDNLFNALNIILFLVFLLMVYAQLSLSHYFFMIILIANITIGLIQDIHSRRLTDKLKVLAAAKVKVLRNGIEMEIESEAIVLSDIIMLSAGDQIPADCVVVEGVCRVDESLLSGESVPAHRERPQLHFRQRRERTAGEAFRAHRQIHLGLLYTDPRRSDDGRQDCISVRKKCA